MFENLERKSKVANPILEQGNVVPNVKKVAESEAQKKQNSRRNIKIYDDAYRDLVALSQCKNMTHNELIIWLVSKAVSELDETQSVAFKHLRTVLNEEKTE